MTDKPTPTLLCLSHLGWDFVWQRPQHLLSRLANHYPLTYVNEPQLVSEDDGRFPPDAQPYLHPVPADGRIRAWQPIFPHRPDVLTNWRAHYLRLVQSLLPAAAPPPILWFYTPTPYYLLDHLPAHLVVYDVMDNLAGFKGAAADLPAREAAVLARADVVFTGGRSLYEERRCRHPNVHLFPSGVEPAHFAQALAPETPVAPEISRLCANGRSPRAILGYVGVIDERLDLPLLCRLAARHPEWAIVMVGPTAKIDAADLPRLPNIHYTGSQPYRLLPRFLKGFDVCLMPFALNEATRTISPTKALEYMAAHKPIVSTAVPDVVASWGHIVRIAAGPAEFGAAVSAALAETAAQRDTRLRRERQQLAAHTWDHIAAQMHHHLQTALEDNHDA
ncbi:MAG: glycosyltransferase [Anaerolineales bacterium]|nr:glycosyltransferase [Anaerolineales bacterium]